MRLSLRLILFLVVGISLVTFFISRNQVRSEKRGLRADLAAARGNSCGKPSGDRRAGAAARSQPQLRRIVERYANKQQLAGVIIYDEQGRILAESSTLVTRLTPPPVPLDELKADEQGTGEFLTLGGTPMHAYYMPLCTKRTILPACSPFFMTPATSKRKATASGATPCGT